MRRMRSYENGLPLKVSINGRKQPSTSRAEVASNVVRGGSTIYAPVSRRDPGLLRKINYCLINISNTAQPGVRYPRLCQGDLRTMLRIGFTLH